MEQREKVLVRGNQSSVNTNITMDAAYIMIVLFLRVKIATKGANYKNHVC
jgi:hypothetical protein